MTNDQIESAATDHASKYPEHLRTDIVLHYGLGIVRGLKEGSSGDGTIYVPTSTTDNPPKEDGYYFFCYSDLSGSTCSYVVADGSGTDGSIIYRMEEEFPFWLRPTTLPQELAAKDKDKEIEELRKSVSLLHQSMVDAEKRGHDKAEEAAKAEIEKLTKIIYDLRTSRPS